MSSARIYYRIDKDSPVMNVVRDAEARDAAFKKAMCDLKKEFGAVGVWTNGRESFVGLTFEGAPPAGWRAGKQYARPDGRTKSGRDLAKRFRDLPRGVDNWALSSMLGESLGGDWSHWGNNHVYFTTIHQYGDALIISVPAVCRVVPPGCTELLMSEYQKIVDTHEQSKQGVTA